LQPLRKSPEGGLAMFTKPLDLDSLRAAAELHE
jgi:hypothetical protein